MSRSGLIKAAVGLVIVAALFGVVSNWVGDYREATRADGTGSQDGTGTASPGSDEGTPTGGGQSGEPAQALIVAVDGLNFRTEPTGQAKAIRGLAKGEKVTLLSTEGDWFRVRDSKKVVGYITSNPTYTDVAK